VCVCVCVYIYILRNNLITVVIITLLKYFMLNKWHSIKDKIEIPL
jgi:hypothetical protein